MLTQTKVRELFDYNHQTGELTWKVRLATHINIGDVAGSPDRQGYLHVGIKGKRYKNHRLIFLYHNGYLPENEVDHIDRDIANNRIENLRELSKSCNLRNSKLYASNKSGIKGVLKKRNSNIYVASIYFEGKNRHLYYGTDFVEAAAHRLAAEQAIGYDSCDAKSPSYIFIKEALHG